MRHRIHFPQFGKRANVLKGKNILDYAKELKIPISSSCGERGICKECRIVIEKGCEVLNEKTELENDLNENERLACQAIIKDDSTDIHIRLSHQGSLEQIATEGGKKEVKLNPLTRKKGKKVLFDDKEISGYGNHIYGIAADIGTTTIVLHLVDLESGKLIFTSAFENPQRLIDGNDVISRIMYDREKPHALYEELISCINEKISKMPCDNNEIYEMVVVGNSTMRDMFFGLDVQSIGVKPFKSVTELKGGSTFLNKRGSNSSLRINKNANIYGAPLVGSHVGADTTAVCLSTGLFDESNLTAMAIDIGTNGEIVLRYNHKIIATSCAAGPALEPMPALRGAIQRISIDKGEIGWKTIGNTKPVGICGSGIIDLLGELIRTREMDENGYLVNRKVFKITDKVQLTQNAIKGENGLMWSKAAISLGIKVLLQETGISTDDLDRVYLAGSFGSYIDKKNARRIGLIPAVPLKKVVQVGNAAAEGAKEILLSRERRRLAEESVKKVKHIDLELIPNYGERLMLDEQNFKKLKFP
ncbi:hypothetical protein LCGC14_1497760 [marine sediment metagenome]|uniref:2Fe-2S ferredoxin-type domain-containing protein n=1 Tax=marine sediment metagenome TaxID=412755 RepID=A0A0F9J4Z7_9ZZZZ